MEEREALKREIELLQSKSCFFHVDSSFDSSRAREDFGDVSFKFRAVYKYYNYKYER